MNAQVFALPDREATSRFGEAMGRLLRPGDVVALVGYLGAGKTTLTQAIARGMGIVEPVTSPTFTLVQEYFGAMPLFHFDTYRLEDPGMVADFGFEEYFARGGVVVLEWADRIAGLLPEDRLTVTLEIVGEPSDDGDAPRAMRVEAGGPRSFEILAGLPHGGGAE